MRTGSGIRTDIIRHILSFFLVQCLFFAALQVGYRMYGTLAWTFYPSALFFHLALMLFLIRMDRFFVLSESGQPLSEVNLANLLTLLRLSLVPTILYLLLLSRSVPLIPVLLTVTVIAFLTDLLDGAVSRRQHQITEIGKYLDSISDYSVLIVISIAFYYFELVPVWFFALIMGRLLFQAVAMLLLVLFRSHHPRATFLGKAAVFATMTLYAFEILDMLRVSGLLTDMRMRILEYIAGAVIVLSVGDKIVVVAGAVRSEPAARKNGGQP